MFLRLQTTKSLPIFNSIQQQQARLFARYLNRGQKASVEMRDNMLAYDQVPDLISKLEPGPHYPSRPMGPNAPSAKAILDGQYNAERFRTSGIQKRNNLYRYTKGRLSAHYELENQRQEIKKIKSKELDSSHSEISSKKVSKNEGAVVDYEIDDQFQLPYGLGFDDIIKKKAALIDGQKQSNNVVMDELISKLGYMDYRDALACNKYIIESKRSGDYHQMARGRVLEQALGQLDVRKRMQIDKKAQEAAKGKTQTQEDHKNMVDEFKLKTLMNNDAAVSELFQEELYLIKQDKEADFKKIDDIHERFDYLKDPDEKEGRIQSKIYDDLSSEDYEDYQPSTELEDEAAHEMYMRYKVAKEELKTQKEKKGDFIQRMKETLKYSGGIAQYGEDRFKEEVTEFMSRDKELDQLHSNLETQMANLRIIDGLKKMSIHDILHDGDVIFGDNFSPWAQFAQEAIHDESLPEEVRKLLSQPRQDRQSMRLLANDQESSTFATLLNEFQIQYLKAKWDHHVDTFLSQAQITNLKWEREKEEAELHDAWLKPKIDFMFNYLDFESDRDRTRQRFNQEMHRKSTIEDIGGILDVLTLDSKAKVADYWDSSKHIAEQPLAAQKDLDSKQFDFMDQHLASLEPIQPEWLHDESVINSQSPFTKEQMIDVTQEIDWLDRQRDYSAEALTSDERFEISLFHSMRQDPYYRHHLRNHLAQFADDRNEFALSLVHGPLDNDPQDHVKFDRISLYDFRRTLPQKEREPKLDHAGKAWGSGKRKCAIAVANVRAGTGKIRVNGMPLLQYFRMPSQRQRILLPLTVTQYTCLLDINITVTGGGHTGQCEACVPAIAKALQAYDVETRPILKYLRLMRNDPRRVERKKPGKLKARKSQTYVRR